MQTFKRVMSLLLVVMLLSAYGLLAVAADTQAQEPLTIVAPSDTVQKNKKLLLAVNTGEAVKWSSSNNDIAEVSDAGVVKGVSIGKVVITAAASDGRTAEFTVYVTRAKSPLRSLLQDRQMFGYQYSYKGDYFYTNDQKCWQKYFGFNFGYDWVAPLGKLDYDYVRIFFPYEGKDWMIQLWKGQYGLLFYGGEVGVYTRPEGAESATRFAHYASAGADDHLMIGADLYHKNSKTGEYEIAFERPYEEHWWCTGFIPGHLKNTEPCNELRLVTHITFKDAKMSRLFCEGLLDSGFAEGESQDKLAEDTFYRNGADVYVNWQNVAKGANAIIDDDTKNGTVSILGAVMLIMFMFSVVLSAGLAAIPLMG